MKTWKRIIWSIAEPLSAILGGVFLSTYVNPTFGVTLSYLVGVLGTVGYIALTKGE